MKCRDDFTQDLANESRTKGSAPPWGELAGNREYSVNSPRLAAENSTSHGRLKQQPAVQHMDTDGLSTYGVNAGVVAQGGRGRYVETRKKPPS